ncbi:hypothetical protein lbkm_2722 [Lachnospiraceae bacterium KM106-2]|nr:hypothetical protein lbkm_2722 [Lachnospiraceae bacterium KM106-2]
MKEILNEKVVMQFYLEELSNGNIDFLEHKKYLKKRVEELLGELVEADAMNQKIQIATGLWKVLFEASMSYIDPEKQGYNQLFSYFDEYVEFEELIFASDSFYRDHTLHCLWVYFLGEYICRKPEYYDLFEDNREDESFQNSLKMLFVRLGMESEKNVKRFIDATSLAEGFEVYYPALRCVSALTHDLGYPLKKIEKINKSIRKVMPYYAINQYEEFSFDYSNLQQHFLQVFLDILSYDLGVNLKSEGVDFLSDLFLMEKEKVVGLNEEAINKLTKEQIELLREKLECRFGGTTNEAIRMAYANDLEAYQHGIMSAYLLMKNVKAFQDLDSHMDFEVKLGVDMEGINRWNVKKEILNNIANHTSSNYRIRKLDKSAYLTFIDELEEFSRLSRASQSREYVQEFCTSRIYMDEGWLNIDFTFDNEQLDNLNPEIAFKGRCKRFLTLFDIGKLSPNLKIRLNCIGEIESDHNCYTLEIARKYADIMINQKSICIPEYLKSNEFYSKEEYMAM